MLFEVLADQDAASAHARLFLGSASPAPAPVMISAVERLTQSSVGLVVRGGWLPSDLGEVVRRRLAAELVPALAALLAAEAGRHPTQRVAPAWRRNLDSLGPAEAADPRTVTGLQVRLGLLALLHTLPGIPTLIPAPGSFTGTAATPAGIDPKLLVKVRALLAKAESTEFPEEAEVLSAKAQELISRYALDRLWLSAEHHAGDPDVATSRMWIDPPYLMAKATLISVVARANRCRTVVSDDLGFTTIVGEPGDVQAVELLATSLLVQASGAMLGHGSQMDWSGTSRTRSFRQSFLLSFATRIGERLSAATETATEATGHAGELVPVLQRQAERIDAAFAAMFPDVVRRPASVSNARGWAAGRAAADLARLDVRGQVAADAG
ncbi:MAG: DUF2786 domain-containing protein [Jiangellaceae bacterium]|nr:DUF2786 domain-containing protein [Jiangellaceae bacterium]